VAVLAYAFFAQLMLLGLSLWVLRTDHGTIDIVAYDQDGVALDSAAFLRRWMPALIVRDADGSPVYGLQYGLRAPHIAVPIGQPLSLELLWEVPGFGKVLIEANNAGRGYVVERGVPLTLELVPELARGRLHDVQSWVERRHHGTFASDAAGADVATAARLVDDAARATDGGARARLANEALRLTLHAGEQEVLAEARQTIATRRRGWLRIRIADAHSRPLPNVPVDVHQQRFDFLFGIYSDNYDAESTARLRGLGLNYAQLFMTWDRTEPAPGRFSLDAFDRFFTLPAVANGEFTVCGHALVWLANGEVPPYLSAMQGNADALIAAVHEHVGYIVNRYGDRVHIWEALNEGHPQWSRWGLNEDDLVRVARASADQIRRLAPASPIMIEVTLPLAEDVALKHYPLMQLVSLGRIGPAAWDPYRYLQRLNAAAVPYDVLALQIYNGAWMHIAWGLQVPSIDLFRLARVLEHYEAFGKPLQIAEIAVGSVEYGSGAESWWHARADEHTQADYLEGVFTLAYGTPSVQGVNWWGLDDDYRFVEAGGIFDAHRHPKLAARRVAELLDRWRGSGQVTTDEDGEAWFQGATGDYEVRAHVGTDALVSNAQIVPEETATVMLAAPRDIAPRLARR
jgi:GH35 family endo-1,4-beta-xylanase